MELGAVKGVGAATLARLRLLGIETPADLVGRLPGSYIDFGQPVPAAEARDGEYSLLRIFVKKTGDVVKRGGRRSFFTAEAEDALVPDGAAGTPVRLIWFNQPYVRDTLSAGREYLCFGKVRREGRAVGLTNPVLEDASNVRKLRGVSPVYRTEGLVYQGVFRNLVRNALDVFSPEGIVTPAVLKKRGLPSLADAYREAHFPSSAESGIAAQRRIALEDTVKEIVYYRIVGRSAKRRRVLSYDAPPSVLDPFVRSLPFELSPSQREAVSDIVRSLRSEWKTDRLLSGDVGSGKTVVAVAAMLYAVRCGHQAALMAPTEILAEQHLRTLERLLEGTGARIGYLSSSVRGEERRRFLDDLRRGNLDIAVGTHSLFGEDVEFRELSLAVIDEQHRFGVAQKYDLQRKGVSPDTLILTATPIPRTVLMLLYDELDVSRIERPRASRVETKLVPDGERDKLFAFIRDEAKKGNRSFIVCPRITDSEGMETYSALSLFEELKKGALRDVNAAVLHGRMRAEEKNRIMSDFSAGRTDVLISTTVVEVGIDIAEATVVAVLNSERFGLATLHQLRGRVGRGDRPAYCFLHTSDPSNPRLSAMVSCPDGFRLAELDCELRGGGDYLGKRQSGESQSKYIVPVSPELIAEARDIAVNDLLPGEIELSASDLEFYRKKFRGVTIA